jgi:proteic killer suppression protein
MIKTFRHKGLKRLFERGNASGVRADQVTRIRDVLAHLDQADAQPISICPDIGFPAYNGI